MVIMQLFEEKKEAVITLHFHEWKMHYIYYFTFKQ